MSCKKIFVALVLVNVFENGELAFLNFLFFNIGGSEFLKLSISC